MQADILVGASLGCHVVTALTALAIQDSAGIEDIQAVAPEFIDDQARSLLEDMSVHGFKVGNLYSPESVSAVAQVVADYPDVPLVLHLGMDPVDRGEEGQELADATVVALCELLVPQADVVVIDHRRLEQWHTEGLLGKAEGDNAVQTLLALGPEHVLVTGVPHAGGSPVNVLAGEDPQAEAWSWRRLPGSYAGAGSTLSAALAALLAGGQTLRQAVIDAQQYTRRALEAGFQPGMGRAMPDRMFWMRSSDDDADQADEEDEGDEA
ncbi:hydroxymethylpyrimidine/phosphomethylpyrimidine kinase [Verticiella sediminum]|uniref:hydroxymethylpyrimidine kinase n=2 Tax=Verticiella sediminum TaxID=1247510 RepID=A0A556A7I3_9BURK|nr:hydroxymethylpyrimidine/phosphomethylpyrimidine kinase [Verticiella sediminum]